MSGRVVEANGTADESCCSAASAMPENLVTFADLLAREIKKFCRGNAGLARQPVTSAMRHERETAWL
jgi:hypothetical protein